MTQVQQSAPVASTPSKKSKFMAQLKQSPAMILVVIVSLLLLFWLLKTLFFAPTAISVVGSAEISAPAESVELIVTRVDSDVDTNKAISDSEASLSKLVAVAKEVAGNDISVQKSFYQVTPIAVAGDIMYQVTTAVKIVANDPSKASDLVKTLYVAGATTISNVNFIPADQDQVTQDARKAAIKDARSQAKSMARAAGKRVGRMISISDDSLAATSTLSSDMGSGSDLAAEMGATSVSSNPSQIDVSKAVTVTYYLW